MEEDGQDLAQRGGGAIEVLEQLRAVHALDAVEELDGKSGLVRLEMPDEFPRDDGGRLRFLPGGLPHAVFADCPQAVARGIVGGGGGMGLGHREQFDTVARIAAGARCTRRRFWARTASARRTNSS